MISNRLQGAPAWLGAQIASGTFLSVVQVNLTVTWCTLFQTVGEKRLRLGFSSTLNCRKRLSRAVPIGLDHGRWQQRDGLDTVTACPGGIEAQCWTRTQRQRWMRHWWEGTGWAALTCRSIALLPSPKGYNVGLLCYTIEDKTIGGKWILKWACNFISCLCWDDNDDNSHYKTSS